MDINKARISSNSQGASQMISTIFSQSLESLPPSQLNARWTPAFVLEFS